MTQSITLIGGGAMGEAMLKVALDKGVSTPERSTVSELLPGRRQELADRYGVRVTDDNAAAGRGADTVVLAVKPQVLPAVLGDLCGQIPTDAVVLSIVAGARLEALQVGLGHTAVVRSMPNTPAQIGQGMAVWTASEGTSEEQSARAEAILQAMGAAIQVHDEKYIDMATGVSGSGPAYVFLIMEAMVDAAVHMGFARAVARELVLQTVLGSVLFAQQSGMHLAQLRNMVTSPGGTTAEALYHLEKGGVRAAIDEALMAAYRRSQKLGS